MWTLVVGIGTAVVPAIAVLWYNARKAATAESSAVAEKAARTHADARVEALENAQLRQEAEARKKDVYEGTAIVHSGDARAARDYLLRTFPAPRTPGT